MLEISCDEAGHTGSQLLNPDQRFFGFASVAVSDMEARLLIEEAREKYPVQMPELKAKKLMKSAYGRALIAYILEKIDGRFSVNVHNKLLALCGWIFEYIYEPVYKEDPRILYEKNLHHFVAMYAYIFLRAKDSDAQEAIQQFQKYMRSLDENDAPLLFSELDNESYKNGEPENPFMLVLQFARGYRKLILADNDRLTKEIFDNGKWILDLALSSLWSHLNHWGAQGVPLKVKCDQSKPLEFMSDTLKGDEHDPGIKRAQEIIGHPGNLGWTLSEPIAFVDSQLHPAIQIADMIAGTTVLIFSNDFSENFKPIADKIMPMMLEDSILPNPDVLDLRQQRTAVNWLMLYDLAERAKKGDDPYINLEEMYDIAENMWEKGEFRPVP